MDNKFLLVGILGVVFLMLVFLITLVDATVNMHITGGSLGSANNSNFTGTLTNVTCNVVGVAGAEIRNMTVWYNASAHGSFAAVTTEMLNYTANTSVAQTTNFTISTSSISGLADSPFYTFWCEATNDTGATTSHNSTRFNYTNITIDNTAPIVKIYSNRGVSISHENATAYKNTATVTFNVSVYDLVGLADSAFCFFNLNNSMATAGQNQTVALTKTNRSHGWCNTTHLNLTNTKDGVNITRVWMNDSLGTKRQNSSVYVLVDTSVPSVNVNCNPSSVVEGSTVTCSCSGTDSISSVNSSTDGSTPSTLAKGTFTYSCTVTDQAGNSASEDATYIVNDAAGGSSSGGGGGGGGTTTSTNVNTFTKVTPGKVSIMKVSNKDVGVKEIQIEVNNEAQNIKITVSKHSGKPAAVSVEKSGEVYQYFEVKTSNLEENLKKATMTAKVEKSWLADNGVSNEAVVVSKFDESSKEWNELTTIFDSEDGTYSYFNVELDSFSFFAISEKVVVEEEEDTSVVDDVLEGLGITSSGEEDEERNLTWLWIVIAVLVIAVAYGIANKKGAFSK